MRKVLREAAACAAFAFHSPPSLKAPFPTFPQRISLRRRFVTLHCASSEETERTARISKAMKAGEANVRKNRAARREDRTSALQRRMAEGSLLSTAEQKELNGLLKCGSVFEEQYCIDDFPYEHVQWKAAHNNVFVSLARYCQDDSTSATPINVFYLEGPDAGTTLALNNGGFDAAQCYVANRHASTCEKLRSHLPRANIAHADASEALTSQELAGRDSNTPTNDDNNKQNEGTFRDIPFAAYYFDGCGGFTPLIVDMMRAAFDSGRAIKPKPPIAIGFSILGGNRDVVDKEQEIVRKLAAMVKQHGLRVEHVFDDPERYGLPSDTLLKVDGGTMTTWCILEADDRDRKVS
jgi:hypothetical protein